MYGGLSLLLKQATRAKADLAFQGTEVLPMPVFGPMWPTLRAQNRTWVCLSVLAFVMQGNEHPSPKELQATLAVSLGRIRLG